LWYLFLAFVIIVYSNNWSTWFICSCSERYIPFKSLFTTTGYTLNLRNCWDSTLVGEMLFKNAPIVVSLFGWGSHCRESCVGKVKNLIWNTCLSMSFHWINPWVANSIWELLLLSPQDIFWQVSLSTVAEFWVKCFPQDRFFHALILSVNHFVLCINVHDILNEIFIEERNSCLNSKT